MSTRSVPETNSAIFEELLKDPSVDPAVVARLREKYNRLHQCVMAAFSNEQALLRCAKGLKKRVAECQLKWEKRKFESSDTEADLEELRRKENETSMRLQRLRDQVENLQWVAKKLEESHEVAEKQLSEKEAKQLRALAPVMEELNRQKEELKSLNSELQDSLDKESQVISKYQERLLATQQEATRLEKEKIRKREELLQFMETPMKLRSLIKDILQYKREKTAELEKVSQRVVQQETRIKEVQLQRDESQQAINGMNRNLAQLRNEINKRRANLNDFRREMEVEKLKGDELKQKLMQLEEESAFVSEALDLENQALQRANKTVEDLKRAHEKKRRKEESVGYVLPHLRQQCETSQQEKDRLLRKFDEQRRLLHDVKEDTELFLLQYLRQVKVEDSTTVMLDEVKAERDEVDAKINRLQAEEKELQKQVNNLTKARELVSQEAAKVRCECSVKREDVKVMQVINADLQKREAETEARLQLCVSRFERMKNSRNLLATKTQTQSQALIEMKENLRLLQNERDILKNETMEHDAIMSEEIRKLQAAQAKLEKCKELQNAQSLELRRKKLRERQQLLEIQQLNSVVSRSERKLGRLKQNFESAVDAKNIAGIQLIDRNDELCILYEKHNIQEKLLQEGAQKLQQREEEIKLLHTTNSNLERKIDSRQKQVPSKIQYSTRLRDLKFLEDQLEDYHKEALQMCHLLETPAEGDVDTSLVSGPEAKTAAANAGEPGRCKRLKGTDAPPDQLAAKIHVLEERLNDKKEQLLEKELVLSEVSTLSSKLRLQASESRVATLELAKAVNAERAKLRTASRRTMAVISELSMYQAAALKLEKEKAEKAEVLKHARVRLSRGEPPTEDAQSEWYKLERERMRREEMLLQRSQQQLMAASGANAQPDSLLQVTGAVKSRAPLRPSCYIEESLGLPKPYGNNAPFRPSKKGAQMRHYRKPEPAPIEI